MKKSVIIIPSLICIAALGVCLGASKYNNTSVQVSFSMKNPSDNNEKSMEKDTEIADIPTETVENKGLLSELKSEGEAFAAFESEAFASYESEEKEQEDPQQAGVGLETVDISYGSTAIGVPAVPAGPSISKIDWNDQWAYADKSRIHSGSAVLYKVSDSAKTIAVNAGHGTKGGASVKTLCHPDGSPKITGGSTASGSISAIAVSGGATMLDGTPEAVVNLKVAQMVKDKLVANGYNVLMIRDGDDVQLDNVARSVMANNNADCHISIHYDSTERDKGFFYIGVPDVSSYRNMEPVASHFNEHIKLGESILAGMKASGVKIHGNGNMPLDLTQTSYSTIPSVDLEVGDRKSSYSDEAISRICDAILLGVNTFFAS